MYLDSFLCDQSSKLLILQQGTNGQIRELKKGWKAQKTVNDAKPEKPNTAWTKVILNV